MGFQARAIGVAGVLLLAAPPLGAAPSAVIVQKGRAFHPADIAIAKGETVTFTNDDSFIHQIYVEGLFDTTEKAPGENVTETFPAAGTFTVRCHIHPTMHMTVHVK